MNKRDRLSNAMDNLGMMLRQGSSMATLAQMIEEAEAVYATLGACINNARGTISDVATDQAIRNIPHSGGVTQAERDALGGAL